MPVAGDVDQLARLGLRRADVQMLARGHLVHRDEVFAVGMRMSLPATTRWPGCSASASSARPCGVVPIDGPRRHLPFRDGRLDEQRCVGVAGPSNWVCSGPRPTGTSPTRTASKRSTGIPRKSPSMSCCGRGLQLREIEYRHVRGELAVADETIRPDGVRAVR